MDNYIVLGKGNRPTSVCVNCKGNFFSLPLIVKLENDVLTLEQATPLYSGRTIKPSSIHYGWYTFTTTLDLNDFIKNKYIPDEDESTEEKLVFYLKEPIK